MDFSTIYPIILRYRLYIYDKFSSLLINILSNRTGKVVLQSNRRLHDGLWHDVKISQKGAEFYLVVDSKSVHR